MFLSRSANHVCLLVRGTSLASSMSSYLSSRLEADLKITIEYCSAVRALHGGERLDAVTIHDSQSGADYTLSACALFTMVGAQPNTAWLSGLVKLDPQGYVETGESASADSPDATSQPGIFAVRDVRSGSVKRVASAVGEGSVVISKLWSYMNG